MGTNEGKTCACLSSDIDVTPKISLRN